MVDFTRMWREFKADIMREVETKLRQAGIVGTTIDGAHMPGKTLPGHAHAHSDTTGQTANDHHNQVHDLFGSDHADVDTTTLPTDGQVLVWDAVAEKWKPATASSGAAVLDDLTDVDAPNPNDGDMLTYDEVTETWKAAPAPETGTETGYNWSVLTDGAASPSLVFVRGDVIMVRTRA